MDLPSFDPEAPVTAEPAPKKPRRKPTKRRSAIKAKNLTVVKVRKLRRKRLKGSLRRVVKRGLIVDKPSAANVAVIIGIHAQIQHLLSGLAPVERVAMLDHLRREK